jgi:hypothetical protein
MSCRLDRETIVRVLELPSSLTIEWKRHDPRHRVRTSKDKEGEEGETNGDREEAAHTGDVDGADRRSSAYRQSYARGDKEGRGWSSDRPSGGAVSGAAAGPAAAPAGRSGGGGGGGGGTGRSWSGAGDQHGGRGGWGRGSHDRELDFRSARHWSRSAATTGSAPGADSVSPPGADTRAAKSSSSTFGRRGGGGGGGGGGGAFPLEDDDGWEMVKR